MPYFYDSENPEREKKHHYGKGVLDEENAEFEEEIYIDAEDVLYFDALDFFSDPAAILPSSEGQRIGDTSEPQSTVIALVRHIVGKTLFSIQLRLFYRMAGLDDLYIDLRRLAQSHESFPVRLKKLSELLGEHKNIVPERYRPLLQQSTELTRLGINLYQILAARSENFFSEMRNFADRAEDMLSLEVVRAQLAAPVLDKLAFVPGQLRNVASILSLLQLMPAGASFDEWLRMFERQTILPESVRLLLSEYRALSDQLQELSADISVIGERYPFSAEDNWGQRISWVHRVLNDPITAGYLVPHLPSGITETVNLSVPLIQLGSRFPAGSSLAQQLSWLGRQATTPAPELSQLLAQRPFSEFIAPLRDQLSERIVNPVLFNALLTLADPAQSLWVKSINITSVFLSGVNARQALSYAVRTSVSSFPGGTLLLSGWDWYQSLPAGLSWQDTLARFTGDLVDEVNRDPQRLRGLLPLLPVGIKQSADALSALITLPVGKPWQEVLRWACGQLGVGNEYNWFYQRFVDICLIRGVYETLQQGDAMQREGMLRELSAGLKDYLALQPDSALVGMLDMLPYLPLLASMREEMSTMPATNSWFGWATNLLSVVENHPHPVLNELREKLEAQTVNYLSDSLVEGIDTLWAQLPEFSDPLRFPEASAVVIPDGRTARMPASRLEPEGPESAVEAVPDDLRLYVEGAGIAAMWVGIIYFLYRSLQSEKGINARNDRTGIPIDDIELSQLFTNAENNIKTDNPSDDTEFVQLVINAEDNIPDVPGNPGNHRVMRYVIPALVTVAGMGLTAGWVYKNIFSSEEGNETDLPGHSLDEIRLSPAMLIYMSEDIGIDNGEGMENSEISKSEIDEIVHSYKEFISSPEFVKNNIIGYETTADTAVREKREIRSGAQSLGLEVAKPDSKISNEIVNFLEFHWYQTNGDLTLTDNQVTYKSNEWLYNYGTYALLKINHRYWMVEKLYSSPNKPKKIILVNNVNNEKLPLSLNRNHVWELDEESGDIKEINDFINNLLTWEFYPESFSKMMKDLMKGIALSSMGNDLKPTFKDLKKILFKMIESIVLKRKYADVAHANEFIQALFELKIQLGDDIGFINKGNVHHQENGNGSILDLVITAYNINDVNEDIYNEMIMHFLYGQSSYDDVCRTLAEDILNKEKLRAMYQGYIDKNEKDIISITRELNGIDSKFSDMGLGNSMMQNYRKHEKTKQENLLKEKINALKEDKTAADYKLLLPLNNAKLEKLTEKKEGLLLFWKDNRESHNNYLTGIAAAYDKMKKEVPEMLSRTGKKRSLNKAYLVYLYFVMEELKVYELAGENLIDIDVTDLKQIQAMKKFVYTSISQQFFADELAKKIPYNINEIIWHNDLRDITSVHNYATNMMSTPWQKMHVDFHSDVEEKHTEEQSYTFLCAMLYFLKENKKTTSELSYTPIIYILKRYIEATKELNIFSKDNNPEPEGYYTLSDMKSRDFFSSQYYYNEQFNIYKDRFLNYDADKYVIDSLFINGVSVNSALSKCKNYYYYSISDDAYNSYINVEQNPLRFGRLVMIQLDNDDWIFFADLDGAIAFKKYTQQDVTNNITLRDLTTPQQSMGARYVGSNNGYTELYSNRYYPYDELGNVEETFSDKKISSFDKLWKSFFGNEVIEPQLEYRSNKKINGKNSFEVMTSVMKENLTELNDVYKNGLDKKSGWHITAEILVPFYQVIYNAVTDRYYSPSVSDIASITTDVISVVSILHSVASKLIKVTDDIVRKITYKMATLNATGISGKNAIKIIIADLPIILGRKIAPELVKILLSAALDVIDPLPYPTREIIKTIHRSIKKFSLYDANDFVKNRIFSIRTDQGSSRTAKLSEKYAIKNSSVKLDEMIFHDEKGKYKNIYELREINDRHYFIRQDEATYQVRWDDYAHTWRVINPDNPGRFIYAVPVMQKNGAWVTHSYLPGLGGGKNTDDIFSGAKKEFVIENTPQGINNIRAAKEDSLVKTFDIEKGYYLPNAKFDVVPVGTALRTHELNISEKEAINALTTMIKKGVSVLELLKKYNGKDKLNLQEKINLMISFAENSASTIKNPALDNIDELLSYFVLVEKTDGGVIKEEQVYGYISLGYSTEEVLDLRYLFGHPYTILNSSIEFREFVISEGYLTDSELERYRVRSISSQLTQGSLAQLLDFYGRQELSVKLFKTDTVTPVTEKLATSFQKKLADVLPDEMTGNQTLLDETRKMIAGVSGKKVQRDTIFNILNENKKIKMELAGYTRDPEGKCNLATEIIIEGLKNKGYDTQVAGVLFYKSPSDPAPGNHYAVIARKGNEYLVIDATIEQFMKRENRGYEWLISSYEEWYNKLRSSDKLKNKIIVSSEYSSVISASSDLERPGDLSWLNSRYIKDSKYKLINLPEKFAPLIRDTYKKDMEFLNSKKGFSTINNLEKEMVEIENKKRVLLKREKDLTDQDKLVPNKIKDDIIKFEEEIVDLQDKEDVFQRVENIMFLARNHTEIAISDFTFKTPISKGLVSKIKNVKIGKDIVLNDFDSIDHNGIVMKEGGCYLSLGGSGKPLENYDPDEGTAKILFGSERGDIYFKESSWVEGRKPRSENLLKNISKANPVAAFEEGYIAINHNEMPKNTRLSQISMLGSHDAGTYAFRRKKGIPGSLGEAFPFAFKTQNLNLREQAEAGARYFDIRVAVRSDGSFGFFHGPSVANGDAVADIRELLAYAKSDSKNFYLIKFVFKNEIRKKGTITPDSDIFLNKVLQGYRDNMITFKDTSSLAMAQVGLLEKGKYLGVMVNEYHGNEWHWQYKEQTYTSWANSPDAKKTADFITAFHANASPEDKLTIIQSNMPFAHVGTGELSLGVENNLGRSSETLASAVDNIKQPGIISADFIGEEKSATKRFNTKVVLNNTKLLRRV
ncbi:hypothetical protein D4100_07325 [Serratia inhibens]|uniref:Tox-PLDMTX domain-containing protein n=1 Tax=Serratia inhibens TaxID=2338073 RepID=A0AA92X8E7_9GAMM|nr:hypothetical protein [Serratia inhibens]RJF58553.1 hypothetical protein D4100_07325 [Serratia inhibens]